MIDAFQNGRYYEHKFIDDKNSWIMQSRNCYNIIVLRNMIVLLKQIRFEDVKEKGIVVCVSSLIC